MTGLTRISMTVPEDQLEQLTRIVEHMGYPNRSKAIQDAISNLIAEFIQIRKAEGVMTGVLITVYNHDFKGLEEKLTDIQHHHRELISSSTHVHLDENNCLETMIVRGNITGVATLFEEIKTRKGVKQAKLVTLKQT